MGQSFQGLGGRETTPQTEASRDRESRSRAFAAPDAETRRVLDLIVRNLDRLPE